MRNHQLVLSVLNFYMYVIILSATVKEDALRILEFSEGF